MKITPPTYNNTLLSDLIHILECVELLENQAYFIKEGEAALLKRFHVYDRISGRKNSIDSDWRVEFSKFSQISNRLAILEEELRENEHSERMIQVLNGHTVEGRLWRPFTNSLPSTFQLYEVYDKHNSLIQRAESLKNLTRELGHTIDYFIIKALEVQEELLENSPNYKSFSALVFKAPIKRAFYGLLVDNSLEEKLKIVELFHGWVAYEEESSSSEDIASIKRLIQDLETIVVLNTSEITGKGQAHA